MMPMTALCYFTQEDGRTVITCSYDYQGRRFEKKVAVNGSTVSHAWYLYQGYLQIAELDLMRPSYRLVKTYLWDPTESTATRILMMTNWKEDGTSVNEHLTSCMICSKTSLPSSTVSRREGRAMNMPPLEP